MRAARPTLLNRMERLMARLTQPGKIHDQFCRKRCCRPATDVDDSLEQIVAIICMLLITGATIASLAALQ